MMYFTVTTENRTSGKTMTRTMTLPQVTDYVCELASIKELAIVEQMAGPALSVCTLATDTHHIEIVLLGEVNNIPAAA